MRHRVTFNFVSLLILGFMTCAKVNQNWADYMNNFLGGLFEEDRSRGSSGIIYPRPELNYEGIKCKKWICACYNPNESYNIKCEYNEDEKKCWDRAECKVQNNGKCGFTITNDYKKCLDRARGDSSLTTIPESTTTIPESNFTIPDSNLTVSESNFTVPVTDFIRSEFNLTTPETNLTTSTPPDSIESLTNITNFSNTTVGLCRPTGCYNSECSSTVISTTGNCTNKPEYDCYKLSKCEESLGDCSWTHNPDFFNCLENARLLTPPRP